MMKIYRTLPAFIIALVVLSSGCNNNSSFSSDEITVPVRVEDVKLGSIATTLSATGTVSPVGDIELNTEAAGKYNLQVNPRTGRPYELGDKVAKGEIIIKIEDEEYTNNIRLETKKLDLYIKESAYTKQKSLYEKGGVTQTEMQQADVSFINSKYDYEMALLQLEMLNVSAPIDGVIVKLPYFTPKVKLASGTAVLSVMDYSKLMLNVNFPEKYINTIQKGQHATISNYNIPDETLQAVVTQLSPVIDENSRTFSGVIEVANPRLSFRPGMFVNADIVLEKRDSVITVPNEIITKGRRGDVVYTVARNTAEAKRIKIGLVNDTQTEIIEGLEVGERVVVDGYQMLSNRAKVKVIK